MKHTFACKIEEQESIHQVPGSWTADDCRALLTFLDYPDAENIPDGESPDMALLALQDHEPLEAAERVLSMHMSDLLTPGQINNCASELREEPLWEEYPEPKAHRRFFECADLLHRAYPGPFVQPVAVRLILEFSGKAEAQLRDPLEEAFVLRILVQGMDDASILRRMHAEVLETGGPFPEAVHILWDCTTQAADGKTARVELISSSYWMRGLTDTEEFQATLAFHGDDD